MHGEIFRIWRLIKQCWEEIPKFYPQTRILKLEIMPDHIHGIIHVQERLPVHLSTVINGFNTSSRKALLRHGADLYTPPNSFQTTHLDSKSPSHTRGILWENGYCDRILSGKDMLDRWFTYLSRNPLRLALKRTFPDLFSTRFGLNLAGRIFNSIGNRLLVTSPWKIAVQLSRSLTEEQIQNEITRHLQMADEGAILVSPALSPAEKRVMRAALDHGYPTIYIASNGLDAFSRPGNEFNSACAEGRFLIISHLERSYSNKISREFCLSLNHVAKEVAEWKS